MVVNGPRYAGPHFFKKKNGAPLRGAPINVNFQDVLHHDEAIILEFHFGTERACSAPSLELFISA